MTSSGTVREWDEGAGWGVIDSADTPGGCWTHYSVVAVEGYRVLRPGQEVRFEFAPAAYHGYTFAAEQVWPADQPPVRDIVSGPGAGYTSELTVTFDDPDGDEAS